VRRSIVPVTAAATVTVCGALIAVASCHHSGGVREEGTASTDSAAVTAYATPSAATGTDPVKLLKKDPKVAPDIREDLVSCGGRTSYPVETRFGDLTGTTSGARTDMVVNVSTCADGVGIGSYVYRLQDGKYRNVFVDEQPPVVAEISDGELKVTHQVYEPQDSVSNPSGEDITTYRWTGTRFGEVSFTHRDYGAHKDSHG
jgi:hypothetical protein